MEKDVNLTEYCETMDKVFEHIDAIFDLVEEAGTSLDFAYRNDSVSIKDYHAVKDTMEDLLNFFMEGFDTRVALEQWVNKNK